MPASAPTRKVSKWMFDRGRARRRSARGATSRRRVTIIFPSGVSSSFLSGAFWFFCCTECGASSAGIVAWWSRRCLGAMVKHHLTRAYMLFLARWARKLSWKETAEAFHTDALCLSAAGRPESNRDFVSAGQEPLQQMDELRVAHTLAHESDGG